uniref:Uncharacterized protein n=1 Tax=Sphaerodactylus townsendi TaxID=933632 RepID=A0ACB8E9K1_9SAUR
MMGERRRKDISDTRKTLCCEMLVRSRETSAKELDRDDSKVVWRTFSEKAFQTTKIAGPFARSSRDSLPERFVNILCVSELSYWEIPVKVLNTCVRKCPQVTADLW